MNLLDMVYRRTYESNINNKMLYYNYVFPTGEVEDYVRQILNIPIEKFVQYDVKSETISVIEPKDVFQFSSLEAGTDGICKILNDLGNPGVTFIQAGKLLLDDGKQRSDEAYIKYGENHLKTAEALGLLFELTRTYFVSCIGVICLKLNEDDRKNLIIRLFLRNKLIARLLKASVSAKVDARQFLFMISDSTYIRRKSSIICILKFLRETKEFDFSGIIDNIYF